MPVPRSSPSSRAVTETSLPQVFPVHLELAGYALHVGDFFEGQHAAVLGADRQLAERVFAARILGRQLDADVLRPVPFKYIGGGLAENRGFQGRADITDRQASPCRVILTNVEVQGWPGHQQPVVNVHDPGDRPDRVGDLLGLLAQHRQFGREDLDLDRLGLADHVADQIAENTRELSPQPGFGSIDLFAQIADDLFCRTAAVLLQFDEQVAIVRFGDRKAESVPRCDASSSEPPA